MKRPRDTFAATPIDRVSIPQGRLDIATQVRTNPLPWTGQFSPQLVEELLTAYAPHSGVVLDPFVGSGTALVESGRLGLGACGADLNPAAVVLARVYETMNLDAASRAMVLDGLRNRLQYVIDSASVSLFFDGNRGSPDRRILEAALVGHWRDSAPGAEQALSAALVVLSDFYRKRLDVGTVQEAWRRLDRIVRHLPEANRTISVHHADARALPIEDDSIDLVLTSPPYINVHNYHQNFRRSAEALKWDVLAIARSEIGSNRQNRGNRFLTVIQYSMDMALALREMARVTKLGSRLILVVGRESSVRGARFYNGEIVAELAVRGVGVVMEGRQERMFRNRYGASIYEDILHFRVTEEVPEEGSSLRVARCIARQALLAAYPHARPKERAGLDDALTRLETVTPSPMLRQSVHLNESQEC